MSKREELNINSHTTIYRLKTSIRKTILMEWEKQRTLVKNHKDINITPPVIISSVSNKKIFFL